MKTEQILINTQGEFYSFLKSKNNYGQEYLNVMENTVKKLLEQHTSANKPGMLLGKIQSGKTRTFLGIMGLAYDNGYDVVIILTKGTKALAKQTLARINQEFSEMIKRDKIKFYDIMKLPSNLIKWELNKKIAIIVKKETRNMDRLNEALFETYPELKNKNILFIDDEADYASISFENNSKKNIVEMKKIASKIDKIRAKVNRGSFLQVTATPYSLYLQPDDREINDVIKFEPIRPAFTELVPIHNRYIGGDFYFEESKNKNSPAYYLYQEITENDLEVMKKMDLRRVRKQNLLTQKNLNNLNWAVINFIVGSCIRRWQQRYQKQDEEKYCMVVHTERGKKAHDWQQQLIKLILEDFVALINVNNTLYVDWIEKSYKHLLKSIKLLNLPIPSFNQVLEEVKESITKEMIVVTTVNSDNDVEELLDYSTGQLLLRAPMNIFIGGQIIDRGITINNLIGFFYGRNPKSFQQDTVFQDNHVEWDNVPYCAINQSDYEKYKLEKNDILIARTGATTGKSYRIEEEVNAVFASYLIRVRLNELADASYVDYFMKSSVYWNQIMVSKKGIAQPGANSKILGALKIPLPNIWEQKRIAEKIKFLFSKIDKAKQLIEEAKESFELRWESILNKAFTGELTHKWRKENPAENVDDLVQQLKSIYSRSEFNEVLTNETLPEIWKCFRMADVIEINPTKDKLENINDEKEVSFVPMAAVSDELGIINAMESREYKRVKKGYTYFRENDILFAKITPCMENGKCAIAKNLINRFGFGSTEFYVLRASEFINPYYVYYFLRSKKFRAKAQAAMTGAVGQQRVPKIFLKDYPFPLPPKREQDKIVEILNSLKKYEFKIQEMINILEDLNLLKQSILSMAFKGELGTNAPTDEPAIELLKSILQEQL